LSMTTDAHRSQDPRARPCASPAFDTAKPRVRSKHGTKIRPHGHWPSRSPCHASRIRCRHLAQQRPHCSPPPSLLRHLCAMSLPRRRRAAPFRPSKSPDPWSCRFITITAEAGMLQRTQPPALVSCAIRMSCGCARCASAWDGRSSRDCRTLRPEKFKSVRVPASPLHALRRFFYPCRPIAITASSVRLPSISQNF